MQNHTTIRPCSACNTPYPRTSEYWHKNKALPDGLAYLCKVCARARATKHFREHHSEKLKYAKAYYDTHKEQHALGGVRWAAQNPDKVAAIKRAYLDRNPERRKQSANSYAHSEKGRIAHQRRRARREDLPDTLTEEQWQYALVYWGNGCAVCGERNRIHADHWIALSIPECPGTIASNIVPLCRHCNLSKHNRPPLKWAIKKFGESNGQLIIAKVEAYLAEWSDRLL